MLSQAEAEVLQRKMHGVYDLLRDGDMKKANKQIVKLIDSAKTDLHRCFFMLAQANSFNVINNFPKAKEVLEQVRDMILSDPINQQDFLIEDFSNACEHMGLSSLGITVYEHLCK